MKKHTKSLYLLMLSILLFIPSSSFPQDFSIPSWIKNNAAWWSDNLITDDDFLTGIEYLIEKNVIQIPETVAEPYDSKPIPDWVRNNAAWWSQNLISDKDFVSGIQYLIKINLIQVNSIKEYAVSTQLPLMVPILNLEDPDSEIKIIKKFLKPGDIFIFPPQLYQDASKLQSEISGLELATGGTSINNLLPGISRIPENVKYVTYDYEPDYTTEWTDDQEQSIQYFKQLHEETKKHNKKLIIVPVYTFGENWDWGEVAKNTDILLIQVQNYQRGGNFPPQFIPDDTLNEIIQKLVTQVNEKSPETKLYLQIGFAFGSQPNDVLLDINDVTNSGIDGLTLWYNPGTSGKTSKFDLLKETLENLERP